MNNLISETFSFRNKFLNFYFCIYAKIKVEQISNIIIVIKNRLGENYEENEFKRLVREELTMRQYSEEVINEWIENI